MDRRSTFARAAVQGLLSGLTVVACNAPQGTPTTPVAPMDPPIATSPPLPGSRRVGPAPPPLPAGTVRSQPPPYARDLACCAGRNECKGMGGCGNQAHDCAGKNECKGTSTACPPSSAPVTDPFASPKNCCKGKNECKGKSECKIPGYNACRGQNDCKGKGTACTP